MRFHMILKFRHLVLIAVLISPTTVSAIIMRHDVSEARYRDLGERFRPLVVQMGITRETGGAPILWNGMGTLIDPRWVLTAAHVANYIPGAPGGPRPSARHYVFVQGRGYLVD